MLFSPQAPELKDLSYGRKRRNPPGFPSFDWVCCRAAGQPEARLPYTRELPRFERACLCQWRSRESNPRARQRKGNNPPSEPFAPKAPAETIPDAMRDQSLDISKIAILGKLSRVAMPASRLFIFTTPEHAHLAIRRHDRPWLLVTAPHAQVHDLIAPSIMPFPHFGAQHRPFLADLPARQPLEFTPLFKCA